VRFLQTTCWVISLRIFVLESKLNSRIVTYFFVLTSFIYWGCEKKTSTSDFTTSVSSKDSLNFYSKIDSANIYRIKGNIKDAKRITNSALEKSIQLNWGKGMAESYTNLAYINLYENDFESAMENGVEGLRIAEICEDKKNQGFANLLIGYVYLNIGDTNQVLSYYKKSLEIRLQLADNYDIGFSYSYLGNYYLAIQQKDSALFYHNKALEYRLKTNDTRSIADSYLLIGATQLKQKKFEQANENFQKAVLQYAKINDLKRLAETYRNFAEVYMSQGKVEDAQNFLLQANQLAIETGSIDNQIAITEQLAAINYLKKNYKEAYDYLAFHNTYYKKNTGESKYRDIVKNILEYKNEKEKKIKQLEFDQKEERQKIIEYAGITIIILIVGFLIFLFNRLKVTRKQNKIIAFRKTQIDKAYIELETKNKEILDSINYAKRIQSAILPSERSISSAFKDIFILYLPKDIVAGDFYWLEQKDDKILVAAADCTGHGVPGAMVSVVCNNSLNRSVHEYGLTNPASILNKTKELVENEFAKSSERMMDGMDIALFSIEGYTNIHTTNNAFKIEFSGANNPMWVIRKEYAEIEEYKGDKIPIGLSDSSLPFTNVEMTLNKGDVIYLFSDGFADQFGGEKGKKFKSSGLKSLFLSIKHLSMMEQQLELKDFLSNWQGNLEQVDDVCVIGIRL
jgi:serine phosphatase RsbU (regulator of sigma subunit)/tetratricopeptide (TPR) repeat protein